MAYTRTVLGTDAEFNRNIEKIQKDVRNKLSSKLYTTEGNIYKMCNIPYPLTPENREASKQKILRRWEEIKKHGVTNSREAWFSTTSRIERIGVENAFVYFERERILLMTIMDLEGWKTPHLL